jgi:acyl carrier protein
LPEYIIPTYFVHMESLPLTLNGKVDQRSLPMPDRLKRGDGYIAPRNPLEKELSIYWTEVLGIEQIGVEDNFFEIGGHSLLATQLVFQIRDALQLEIPLRALFEQPTIAGMAQIIEALQDGKVMEISKGLDAKDLRAEVVLDSDIEPHGSLHQHVMEPQSILLTGATGFLGVFLLHELLQQTRANMYCLIRPSDQVEGGDRIKKSLEKYGLWNPLYSARIVPVVGDLSHPLLGLSDEQFNRLAEEIDVIYHNGALVNYVAPYSVSKRPNVLGTQEVLRLACRFKLKPVHYVSTLFSRVRSEH